MQPIVEQLDNNDIRNLGAYFASLQPPEKKEDDDPDLSAKGKQAAAGRRCASCHLDSYAGTKAVSRIAEGVFLARDLINTPSNDKAPEVFAREAQALLRGKGVRVQVLGPDEIRRARLGGVIGVGQGTEGEVVDVVDMNLNEVVKLIRGKRGTVVRLKVIPVGQTAPTDPGLEHTINSLTFLFGQK